jgi:protein-tyrosine phosphatase
VRGAPASSGAVIALSSLGVDLSCHRSKPLEDVAVEQFPLVLVMTDEHRRDLLSRYPALPGRVYLLAEMAGTECDVEDPYGEGVQFYARTTEQIRGYLVAGLGRMQELGLMRGFP